MAANWLEEKDEKTFVGVAAIVEYFVVCVTMIVHRVAAYTSQCMSVLLKYKLFCTVWQEWFWSQSCHIYLPAKKHEVGYLFVLVGWLFCQKVYGSWCTWSVSGVDIPSQSFCLAWFRFKRVIAFGHNLCLIGVFDQWWL